MFRTSTSSGGDKRSRCLQSRPRRPPRDWPPTARIPMRRCRTGHHRRQILGKRRRAGGDDHRRQRRHRRSRAAGPGATNSSTAIASAPTTAGQGAGASRLGHRRSRSLLLIEALEQPRARLYAQRQHLPLFWSTRTLALAARATARWCRQTTTNAITAPPKPQLLPPPASPPAATPAPTAVRHRTDHLRRPAVVGSSAADTSVASSTTISTPGQPGAQPPQHQDQGRAGCRRCPAPPDGPDRSRRRRTWRPSSTQAIGADQKPSRRESWPTHLPSARWR